MLAFPAENAELALSTDASETGMGAVLEQRRNGSWQPLAFFSRGLDAAQRKYSTFDRELLAAHTAAQHFNYMLDGRSCILFTDHKPLVHAWKKAGEPWSARQQRHLSTLAEVFTDVRHKPGKENVVADALSRETIHAVYQGVSPNRLKEEQEKDEYTHAARTAITNMQLKDMPIGDCVLLCDTSMGYPRPLVPPSLRREVFDSMHGLSHPGTRATKRLISKEFAWHHMSRDVTIWCRECQECQKAKVHRHTKTAIPVIPVPEKAFCHVHVDIVGPLPYCHGYSYLLTVVDRYSRWPDAIPLKGITAEECAAAFISQWVARHGVPRDMTSDRGRQFISEIWRKMGESLGSHLHFTTAYHPQANGLVERFHRSMKAALRAKLTDANWLRQLPWVLLGLRTTEKDDLKNSPAELIYRNSINLPGTVIDGSPASNIANGPTLVKHHRTSPTYTPPGLLTSKSVWLRTDAVRRPLESPYTGPYPVLEKHDKHFVIRVFGQERSVSLDRLKPAIVCDADCDATHQRTRSGRISKPPTRFS